MGTACHLISSAAPWQITMEGVGNIDYIRCQALDIIDSRKGRTLIKEAV